MTLHVHYIFGCNLTCGWLCAVYCKVYPYYMPTYLPVNLGLYLVDRESDYNQFACGRFPGKSAELVISWIDIDKDNIPEKIKWRLKKYSVFINPRLFPNMRNKAKYIRDSSSALWNSGRERKYRQCCNVLSTPHFSLPICWGIVHAYSYRPMQSNLEIKKK